MNKNTWDKLIVGNLFVLDLVGLSLISFVILMEVLG